MIVTSWESLFSSSSSSSPPSSSCRDCWAAAIRGEVESEAGQTGLQCSPLLSLLLAMPVFWGLDKMGDDSREEGGYYYSSTILCNLKHQIKTEVSLSPSRLSVSIRSSFSAFLFRVFLSLFIIFKLLFFSSFFFALLVLPSLSVGFEMVATTSRPPSPYLPPTICRCLVCMLVSR